MLLFGTNIRGRKRKTEGKKTFIRRARI